MGIIISIGNFKKWYRNISTSVYWKYLKSPTLRYMVFLCTWTHCKDSPSVSRLIADLLLDSSFLLILLYYPITIKICLQYDPIMRFTSEHQPCTSDIYYVSLTYLLILRSVSQGTQSFHFAVHAGFGALPPSLPLQPTCPPGRTDEACHLLVCAEGEMTFERCAKCECTLHSCAAVRSDHCYFSC